MSSPAGYSLIELIVAMISATVLVASLAATVLVTTELLESPPNQQHWQDDALADRLAADLRFATAVDESPSDGFRITRPDPETAEPQEIHYQASVDGLTRQVDDGAAIAYDPEAPSFTSQLDSYSAPSIDPASIRPVRVRSISTAVSSWTVSELKAEIPPGCKSGDLLLLCVGSRSPLSISVNESGWTSVGTQSIDSLRLVALYRSYDSGMPRQVTVSISPTAACAIAVVALENASLAAPIAWSDRASGLAYSLLPSSHPQPLESSDDEPGQLNVQILAADVRPWSDGPLGLASYSDVAVVTAAKGDLLFETSLAVAVRSGPLPSLSSPARVWQRETGYWLQMGLRIEVEP